MMARAKRICILMIKVVSFVLSVFFLLSYRNTHESLGEEAEETLKHSFFKKLEEAVETLLFLLTCSLDLHTCSKLITLWVNCINYRPVHR